MYPISWNHSWWYVHSWSHLVCHFPLRSILTGPPFQGPFPPFGGWLFLVILTDLFSQGLCSMMFIMSKTIIPRSFKFISFNLIGFLELWLFNYPLNFTLSFPTLSTMDWHDTKGSLSIRVSIRYIQYFSSIWWGNTKLLAF